MDVTKAPPPDLPANRAAVTPSPPQNTAPTLLPGPAAPVDRIDIQPLDVAAALQILLAEVRAELAAIPASGATLQSPLQTAQSVLRMVLAAMPRDTQEPTVVAAATTRVEAAVQTALERAVQAVAMWRDVPQAVVDTVRETHVLVFTQLNDDPPTSLWLHPEWQWLLPSMQRYWRRRRLARRGLTDPDWRVPDEFAADRGEPMNSES